VEGGTAIENSLEKLQVLYDRGVRYLSLTWNDSNDWASSAMDETDPKYNGHKGLTDFGRQVIRRMNELGMMVDVSHSGEQTFRDVIETSSKPVIASHSCVWALAPHFRNLKDEQLKALAKKGGVVFLNFYPGFLDVEFDKAYQALRKAAKPHLDSLKVKYGSETRKYFSERAAYLKSKTDPIQPDIEVLFKHMDYIVNLVGEDHVGLGSDFDGISIAPKGIEDISQMPEITRVMVEHGYSESRIRKILGGNFMRVFRAVSGE